MNWLDDLWDAIVSVFSPAPPAACVTTCPSGALTMTQAQALFDRLAAHGEIPFDYPPDCCYARAMEMGDLMAAEGVESRRVWTYGNLVPTKPDGSQVRFPPTPTGTPVEWGYHVAPTVQVQQADGSVQPMVMDPSLTSGPVSVDEWNRIMSGPGSSISQTASSDRSVFYRAPNGTEYHETATDNRKSAFADHIATRDATLRP